jgi:TPR repeat protein
LGYAFQTAEFGLARDEAAAVRWYRLAAEQANADAQINLGAMLLSGWGTPQDGAEALKWYRRAAAHGNLTGEFMVGAVLWDGKAGQAQDRTEAVRHFRIAAEAGDPAAQRMLATAYRLGDGVPADIGQMLVWNHKAAEQGDGLAATALGYEILTGLDGTYDFVEAACWLILAVERIDDESERQRAKINLDNALDQLNGTEKAEAESRAAAWRAKFAAKL